VNLLDSLKSYFRKKQRNEKTENAPEGVCPNCWGSQKWDGEYYKFLKGQNANPSNDIYDNFVKEVARKLNKIQVSKDNYICETCQVNYKNEH